MLNPRICILTTLTLFGTIIDYSPVIAQQPGSQTENKSEKLVNDDYSTAKYPLRNAARGDWKIADGIATVVQDDELYKKYANHGPIMIYEVAHTDATAIVEFKPTDCKTVVFTMDAVDGGHAFRVIMRTQDKTDKGPASGIVTYAEKKVGDERAKMIVLNDQAPKLKNGEWNRIEVSVTGENATVKIGDKSIDVHHARIAQDKKMAKLGFSFGKLSIRKFTLESTSQ